jgi:aminoglycoside 3-N-acetyltransferase I
MLSFSGRTLASLRVLMKVFGEAFEEPETFGSAKPSDEYFNSLLKSETFIPLVATVDGKVVGGLTAYILKKYEQERKEIYIYDLAVLEEYRRRHLATGLINKLREIAHEIGVWVIFVQADPPDEPAIKLYESLGTRGEVLHFDIMPK